jgi:hypothetical protein
MRNGLTLSFVLFVHESLVASFHIHPAPTALCGSFQVNWTLSECGRMEFVLTKPVFQILRASQMPFLASISSLKSASNFAKCRVYASSHLTSRPDADPVTYVEPKNSHRMFSLFKKAKIARITGCSQPQSKTASLLSKQNRKHGRLANIFRTFAWLMFRQAPVIVMGGLLLLLVPTFAGAHVISSSGGAVHAGGVAPPFWRMGLWIVLFVISACLAGAETAITY